MREVPLRLRLKKEQRQEVIEKHPNLGKAPVNYTLKTFKAPKDDIKGMSNEQFEELAKGITEKGCRVPDRELEEKETLDIVLDVRNDSEEGRPPLWKGEIKLPEWLRGKQQTEQTETAHTLPQSLRTMLESNGSETTG
jgi:hypothetical protein